MLRLQVKIPDYPPVFSTEIPVRITDINYGGHLGNDAMAAIFQEARMQFLWQHGFTELNAGGSGMILSDLRILFKNESFYPDVLRIDLYSTEISKVSFQLIYNVTVTREEKRIPIAIGQTTMVCFDYEKRKASAIPEILLNILS